MTQDIVISCEKLTKTYKLYNSPSDRVKEAFHPFRKRYHHPFNALDNISFVVKRGETTGIIGRNGSGKSTLLQVICGILQQNSGQIHVDGRISALLELGAGFNPEFTGRENVYLKASILGIGRDVIDNCFSEIETFADIGEFIDQPVKTYSSGMYVRLAFAVAINVKPSILIIDEALAVGDSLFQAKCFAKFRDFQEKKVTILFVTHSMELITQYCTNAILLEKGKLIAKGDSKEVVDKYNRLLVNCDDKRTGRRNNFSRPECMEPNKEAKLSQHMKNSEVSFQLNPNENRYGNGKAEVIDVGITSLTNETSNLILHGQQYRFWVKVVINEKLINPIIAYTIKDVKGFDIAGTNTYYQEINTGKVNEGEVLLVEFDHKMMLNAGSYLLSFGCAGFENGEYVVYDRRFDMASFDVVSDKPSIGICDLGSNIRFLKIGKL